MVSPPPIRNFDDLRRYESPHVVAVIEALSMLTVHRPTYGLGKARPWAFVSGDELAVVAEMSYVATVEALNHALKQGYIQERPPREGLAWEYHVNDRLVP